MDKDERNSQSGDGPVKVVTILAIVVICGFTLFQIFRHSPQVREAQHQPVAKPELLLVTQSQVTATIERLLSTKSSVPSLSTQNSVTATADLPSVARNTSTGMAIVTASLAKIPMEAQIKAAYLLNFLRQSTFPSNAFEDGLSPYRIVAAEPEVYAALKGSPGRRINGRALNIEPGAPGVLDRRPHLIYSSRASPMELRTHFTSAEPVLSVSDAPDFLNRGGMLELAAVADHIVFRVNTGAVAQAGITLSAKLLQLAAHGGK